MARFRNPRIWAFNALLAVGAFFLALALRRFDQSLLPTPYGAHWLFMVPVVVLAELCMFSIRYRNDGQTFSLGEVSYVFGTAYFAPSTYLFATVIGLSLAFTVRRYSLVRAAFNVAATTIDAAVVIVITRALTNGQQSGTSLRLWLSILFGCSVASVVKTVLVATVRSIGERRWLLRDTPTVAAFTQLNGLAVASMGVLMAIAVNVTPTLAFIAFIPLALLYVFCRQFVKEYTLRTNVEFLYETAQSVHNTADVQEALTGLLKRASDSFHAEFAAVILRRPDGNQWTSITIGQTSGGCTELNNTPRWIPDSKSAITINRRNTDHPAMLLMNQIGARAMMVAGLHVDDQLHGIIVVADHSGDVGEFTVLDCRLFELLANQVAIGLENSQLERSLGVLTRLEEELRHQANHDSLTGLANRSLLTAVLKESNSKDRAVVLIDLDDFKTINDSLGHGAGDEVLIEVAARLRSAVRDGDVVARLGGDEFAIVLNGRDRTRAVEAAERITEAIRPPMNVLGRQVEVHASIGIATAMSGVGLDELLRSADVAMYQAKNAGKGRYMHFESGMDEAARERLQIITGLRVATKTNHISVEYQPIVALQRLETVAVEALLRWRHPELGALGPDRFIPLAEESGAIVALGAWVLAKSCREIGPMRSASGVPLELHVNVSPQQLNDVGFVDLVMNALHDGDMDAHRLILEITEKTALTDNDAVMANVELLRSNGVQLALDDFGTGYSSLAAAHDFPLDLIKIDQLFVRAITAGSEASLVRAILAMADSLGLAPVAEGIETEEQLQKLIQFGCPLGQGYLFSKALTLEKFVAWMESENPYVGKLHAKGLVVQNR